MSTQRVAMASAVMRAFEKRGWSMRKAATETGLSINTLSKLRSGTKLSAESVAKWAEAIGENPAEWIRLAFDADATDIEAIEAIGDGDLVDAVCRALARRPPSDTVKRHWLLHEIERAVEDVALP